MKKNLILALALCAVVGATVGGAWFWKNWAQDAPKISRETITEGPMPGAPMPMDLEPFVPDGAMAVAAFRNSGKLAADFRASNLCKLYEAWAASAAVQAGNSTRDLRRKSPDLGTSELFDQVLGKSVLIAVYPSKASPVAVQFVSVNLPILLFLARADPDVTLKSLLNSVPNALGPAQVKETSVVTLAPGVFAALEKSGADAFLLFGNDLEKIKMSLDLLRSRNGKGTTAQSLAQSNWIRQAFKRIPQDAFSYFLTKDDSLKTLKLGGMPLLVFTDWSVTSLSWNRGFHSSGFSHLSPQANSSVKAWAVVGPSDYPILNFAPQESLLVLATNSLLPENTVKAIREAVGKTQGIPNDLAEFLNRRAGSFADQLDEQALFAWNGFQKSGENDSGDAVAVFQFRSRLRGFMALKIFERAVKKETPNLVLEKLESAGAGESFSASFKTSDGRSRKIFFALRGRWLFLGSRVESFQKMMREYQTSPEGRPGTPLPPGLFPKSNFVVLADAHGLCRNFLTAGPERTALQSPAAGALLWKSGLSTMFEVFSGFKRGGAVFANVNEGIASQSSYPYEEPSVEAWGEKLAAFKPVLMNAILTRQRLKAHQKPVQEKSKRAKKKSPKKKTGK